MELGQKIEISYKVKSSDLAKTLSQDPVDDFPEVFATSRMIAIMELAAARLMRPILSQGELSVGVNVDIVHLAPTPNHAEIRASAKYKGFEGKLFQFEVSVFDDGGEVGRGNHTRAIIEAQRLVEGAQKRLKKS